MCLIFLFLRSTLTYVQHYGAFHNRMQSSPGSLNDATTNWARISALDHPSEQYRTFWEIQARIDSAFAYNQIIKQSAADSKERQDATSKLLALATKNGEINLAEPYGICEALARYYLFVGDKRKALSCIKVDMNLNLQMLDDDDPANDHLGYKGLALNLMFVGEYEHARAAWSLVTPFEKTRKDSNAGSEKSLTLQSIASHDPVQPALMQNKETQNGENVGLVPEAQSSGEKSDSDPIDKSNRSTDSNESNEQLDGPM